MSKAEEIKKSAQKNIDEAYELLPEKYHRYVKILEKKRNIGTPNAPNWVSVGIPYFDTAGRLQMMVDEHKQAEKRYSIVTEFIDYQMGGKPYPYCKCILYLGVGACENVSAHAKVGIGGSGVDATNPGENAETSALGRALAMAGYGIFSGIASADEVHTAMSEQEKLRNGREASVTPYDKFIRSARAFELTDKQIFEIAHVVDSNIQSLENLQDKDAAYLVNLLKHIAAFCKDMKNQSKDQEPTEEKPKTVKKTTKKENE